MADPATTLEAVSLPPSEAIAFLRQKTNVTSKRWTDVWNEAHTQSFMVAGAATRAIVQDFRDAVQKAIEQGTSIGEFRKTFDAIVEKHGWVYNGEPGWRASIIYETNLSTAYSAGRYAQMTEPDTLRVYPYWQYMHTSSARPRPQHLLWVGTTLRADDAWWSTHYPPNGWRCKCSVRPVSEAGLRRQGKRAPDTAPPLDLRPWRSADGRVQTEVPHGIDPGFAYNPGQAWQDGLPPPSPAAAPMQKVRPRMPPAEAVDGEPTRTPFTPAPETPDAMLPALREATTAVDLGPVDASVQEAVGAKVEQALISPPSVTKQLRNHPELTAAEYGALPELLRHPVAVLRISPTRVRLLAPGPSGWVLSAVVKATAARHEMFVLSLHRVRASDLRRFDKREALLAGGLAVLIKQAEDGAPEGPPTNPS